MLSTIGLGIVTGLITTWISGIAAWKAFLFVVLTCIFIFFVRLSRLSSFLFVMYVRARRALFSAAQRLSRRFSESPSVANATEGTMVEENRF